MPEAMEMNFPDPSLRAILGKVLDGPCLRVEKQVRVQLRSIAKLLEDITHILVHLDNAKGLALGRRPNPLLFFAIRTSNNDV